MAYSWQQNKNTQDGKGKYSWQNNSLDKTLEEKVVEEKQVLKSKGLPISVKKNRATPNVLGSIVRQPLKLGANVLSNVLGGTDLSNNYLGKVEGLGKLDLGKSPLEKNNLKVVAKSAGTGAEIASYLGVGGVAKGSINVFKQPLKAFIKSEGKNLLKEGAAQGLAYSLGSQSQKFADDGTPISLKQTLVDTGISTAITPLAGAGLNKLFGKKAVKEVPNIVDTVVKNTDNISENIVKQSDNVNPLINGNKQEVFNGVVNDIHNIKSELPPNIPRVEVSPESVSRDVKEMSNYIEGFDEGTFKQWSQDLRSIPKDELKNVALGGEKTIPNTIPQTAYYAALKNIAKETNDINLSQMLANSPVRSKSGQAQVALQMADKDNLVDDLIEIKKVRAKQVGISDTRYDAEAKSWFDKVSTRIETMKKQIPTIEEVEDIIGNVLICK